ncbi:MAG: DUF192 domain-containing protein [Candidatus Omnitrophica bacterium]|nr:DUF192 domain-containing protein [Candidatus Omnitrophota bacterium]
MRLINQTKNLVLANQVFFAGTLFKRIKGLLGQKVFLPGQGIVICPCNSVHTFFMHFAIDVLFVDSNYRVIKVFSNLAPNRITGIYWRSKRVIELPAGTLALSNTQNKDQLQFLE